MDVGLSPFVVLSKRILVNSFNDHKNYLYACSALRSWFDDEGTEGNGRTLFSTVSDCMYGSYHRSQYVG